MTLAIAFVFSLIGCGGENSCERYVNAVVGCSEEYGADATAYDAETTCAGYDKSQDDYFNCLADAYEGADCATDEGWAAVGTDISECTPA